MSKAGDNPYGNDGNLYDYSSRHTKIVPNIDLDNDDEDTFFGKKRKIEPVKAASQQRRKFEEDSFEQQKIDGDAEDDDDEPISLITPPKPSGKGKAPNKNNNIKSTASLPPPEPSKSEVMIILEDDDVQGFDNAKIREAEEILKSIASVKQSLVSASQSLTAEAPISNGRGRGRRMAIPAAATVDEIDSISTSDDVYIPKVKSANEIIKEKKGAEQKFTGVSAVHLLDVSTKPVPVDATPKITVCTRLNGGHKMKWLLPMNQNFEEFKKRLLATYALPNSLKVSILFDGCSLGAVDTATTADIEEGNLIDVTIPKDAVDAAVGHVGSRDFGLDLPADAPATAPVRSVRIQTRLNGTHKLSWKLPASRPMSEFFTRIVNTYKLPAAATVVLQFDGNKLKGSDTAESLEFEDGDLIDVQVPRAAVNDAIAAVGNLTEGLE